MQADEMLSDDAAGSLQSFWQAWQDAMKKYAAVPVPVTAPNNQPTSITLAESGMSYALTCFKPDSSLGQPASQLQELLQQAQQHNKAAPGYRTLVMAAAAPLMRVARMQSQGAPEQEVCSSSHNKLWTAADVSGWLVKTMRDGQLLRREDIEAVQTHFAGGI
jgi:hypothetical protein